MRNKLVLIFVFFTFLAQGQEDIRFKEFRSKAKLAYLKKEYHLAYQNFNKALLINPSCDECKEKCNEIAKILQKKKPIKVSNKVELVQTPSPKVPTPITVLKPTYIFQTPIVKKIEIESAIGDSVLNEVYLSQNEVTQKEWKVYCIEKGLAFPTITEKLLNDNYPIINISWSQAKQYAEWITEKTGESYDLPTLIEWQSARQALKDLKAEAWIYANSERTIHQPCTKNELSNGLCDIEGNVSEWLEDWSDKGFIEDSKLKSYYEDNENFKNRIVAGCSYREETFLCKEEPFIRSFDSSIHKDFIGFRLVKRNF